MPTIVCDIRDKRVSKNGAAKIRRAIEDLDGKRVAITIDEEKDTRSQRQNRWYWGVIVRTIAEHCGYEKDEMHEVLKYKFLGTTAIEFAGQHVVLPRSSKRLNVDEFGDYCDRIVRWAAQELEIVIPYPDEM